MPPRKQKPSMLLGAVGLLLVIWVIVRLVQSSDGAAFLLLLFAIGVGLLVIPKLIRDNRRQTLLAKANAAIDQHLEQLVRRRAQLVRQDPYGKLQFDKWTKEIDYFLVNHVSPWVTNAERKLLDRERGLIVRIVADRTEQSLRDKPIFSQFSDDLSPTDFEIFCAEQLKRSGWDARVTLQSRDQGVDVIGEKTGVRIVLQCKLYSGPVGNQAVQEIAAGKAHERAHWGAVVTNNRYTPAAEQLAATNGILLLHYSDLPNLDAILQAKFAGHSQARAGTANSVPPTPQVWNCPVCHEPALQTNDPFCRNCGAKMTWRR